MSGFANSFWSSDYAGGLGVLFGKLQQGVQENQQVLTIARLRAEAEDLYGQRLGDIAPTADRIQGGFSKDDGASVRKAFEGVRSEMEEAAKNHRKIASNIRELVVNPFTRWCDAHASRVQNSQDDLQNRIKLHDRQADSVRKFRSQYYNKCRLVEDLEEEDKLAFQEPQSEASQSPKGKAKVQSPIPTIKEPEPEDDPEPIEIGDNLYQPDQVKLILTNMLQTIKIGELKLPIIGTYQNVSTGKDIAQYIQRNMGAQDVDYAEKIGQDMITNGFLRLVGNVGNTFANSSRINYQWRHKVFQLTGIPEKKQALQRSGTALSTDSVDSPVGAVGEYLAGWNPLNNPYPNETPAEKLRREARESDDRYKGSVTKLDALRCNLEEAMIDHLKFMERCELDRLKAIKAVILDFSGAISNVIPSLQSTVDNMMLFQETVQPLGDLRYLLENYRTGQFVPKVQTYENYYNSVDEQTFGVDLEARARSDRKRVPMIVTTILTFLDNHYPDLEGDEARRGIWLFNVPLAATHHLRSQINTGKPILHEILEKYEIPIVASVLKLYLLELPDSLVSSHVYEIVKTIYTTTAADTSDATRVSVIQSTLGQLRLANIATLDAITTHFTRLIELTSADEAYVAALATDLAPCILRPKTESSLSMNERWNYRLLRDLFAHKEAIFGELKRASSQAQRAETTPKGHARPRAISTDESNRRANMEERQKAIASRTRAVSPGPTNRNSHRRDKSRDRTSMHGSAETRFPINTPTNNTFSPMAIHRNSLEVPGSMEASPVLEKANGTATAPGASAGAESPQEFSPVETRDSFGRSGAQPKVARKPPNLARQSLIGGKRDSAGSLRELRDGRETSIEDSSRPVGVELTDKPMDD